MPEPLLAPPRQPAGPTVAAERRRSRRFGYRVWRALRYLVRPSYQPEWGLLRDLSAGGVGLVLTHRVDPGDVLLLELAAPSRGLTQPRLAHVVHARPGPDGNWLVGCRFAPPLRDAELGALRIGLGLDAPPP